MTNSCVVSIEKIFEVKTLKYKYIDLRSDTVTLPTDEMMEAMTHCEVGDDVYEDDPTVNKLQELAADVLGKEAALFVPSGTMGNQLAIMTHTSRGNEIICGENSHIVFHECGAAAILSGVSYKLIHNANDFIYAQDVKKGIRGVDLHYPETGLVCVENALGNGRVVPVSVMKEVYETAKEHDIPVHLDGARIFNAAAALNVSAKDIGDNADSISFCISKGLCAPIGSMLCGSEKFIAKAKKNRKILGGGMRQAGVLAACGIIAIEKMSKRLYIDHDNCKYLCEKLQTIKYVTLDPKSVEINMVFFKITDESFDHKGFVSYMLKNNVKINEEEAGEYRYVTHNGITRENIDYVIDLMQNFG